MLFSTLSLINLKYFLASELGRVSASVIVALGCVVASRFSQRFLNRNVPGYSSDEKREKLVWFKNVLWVLGVFAILGIWGTKIAGFALSLAALAGAILLVSKELLMCLLGYVLLTLSRPFRIGDYIEIGGNTGRVIDINAFSTTLAETGGVHQLTGKTLSFPNSLVLSTAVRNVSATGYFMVNLYRLVVPVDMDIERAEICALNAAEDATAEWRTQADAHLRRIEDSVFIDLPSSRPKVLWESGDHRSNFLTIRFACPIEARVVTEQHIFRKFWLSYRKGLGRKVLMAE